MAVSALTASAASASQWYVGGKALSGSTGLAEATKVEESISFTMVAYNAKITCTSASLEGESKSKLADIIAPGSIAIQSLVLKGCAMSSPAHCSVPTEIETDPLTGQLALGTSPGDTVALGMKGNTFVTFDIEGATCALVGEKPMAGKFTLLAPTGQEELAEQTLTAQGSNEKPAGTTMAGFPVYLSGKLKVKLASASKWSFH
jgi:hypothetical protein